MDSPAPGRRDLLGVYILQSSTVGGAVAQGNRLRHSLCGMRRGDARALRWARPTSHITSHSSQYNTLRLGSVCLHLSSPLKETTCVPTSRSYPPACKTNKQMDEWAIDSVLRRLAQTLLLPVVLTRERMDGGWNGHGHGDLVGKHSRTLVSSPSGRFCCTRCMLLLRVEIQTPHRSVPCI